MNWHYCGSFIFWRPTVDTFPLPDRQKFLARAPLWAYLKNLMYLMGGYGINCKHSELRMWVSIWSRMCSGLWQIGTIFYAHQQMVPQKKTISRAPWKNRISSTSMKLRKSLVKPVTRQNISSSVLSPEIVVYDAFNVILRTSADIYVVVHNDLGWKNQTTRNRFWRAGCSRLEYVDICLVRYTNRI